VATSPSPPARPSQRLWRRRWFGPVAAAVAVAVVAATVLAILLSVPRTEAPTRPAPAPATTPRPAPRASPAPSNESERQQHQMYRVYVSTVVQQGTGLVAALGGLQACRIDRATCVERVNSARQQVAGFQSELASTPAPACLSRADDLLRDGLQFQDRGLGLAGDAIPARDRVRMAQGLLLVVAGLWRETQAVVAGRQASC
jgi:hypothetical protein